MTLLQFRASMRSRHAREADDTQRPRWSRWWRAALASESCANALMAIIPLVVLVILLARLQPAYTTFIDNLDRATKCHALRAQPYVRSMFGNGSRHAERIVGALPIVCSIQSGGSCPISNYGCQDLRNWDLTAPDGANCTRLTAEAGGGIDLPEWHEVDFLSLDNPKCFLTIMSIISMWLDNLTITHAWRNAVDETDPVPYDSSGWDRPWDSHRLPLWLQEYEGLLQPLEVGYGSDVLPEITRGMRMAREAGQTAFPVMTTHFCKPVRPSGLAENDPALVEATARCNSTAILEFMPSPGATRRIWMALNVPIFDRRMGFSDAPEISAALATRSDAAVQDWDKARQHLIDNRLAIIDQVEFWHPFREWLPANLTIDISTIIITIDTRSSQVIPDDFTVQLHDAIHAWSVARPCERHFNMAFQYGVDVIANPGWATTMLADLTQFTLRSHAGWLLGMLI